jgi:hypothetical protein
MAWDIIRPNAAADLLPLSALMAIYKHHPLVWEKKVERFAEYSLAWASSIKAILARKGFFRTDSIV